MASSRARFRPTIAKRGTRILRVITLIGALVLALAYAGPARALGPRVLLTGGPAGEVTSRDATFTFVASSAAPFARFECRLDAGPWTRCNPPTTYAGLVGGPHRFEVRLMGFLVNTTASVRAWVVALGTETLPCRLAERCPNPLPQQDPNSRPGKRRDAGGCAYGGNRVGEVSTARLNEAVACLVSKARVRNGLRSLRKSRALQAAAVSHGRDMVARRYFSHASRDGSAPADRIRGAGYMRGARFWAVGEVMAFTRPSFTPRRVVRAWLRSPAHRRVILTAAFRHIGAAIVRGSPTKSRRGATCVADLGRRG